METSINERVKSIVGALGFNSTRAFAVHCSTAQTTMNDVISKGKEPRYTLLHSILIHNPTISAEWLLRGKEPMLLRPEEKNLNIGGTVIGRDAYNNNINSTINADAEVERLRLELTLAQKQIEQLKEQIKAKDEQIIGLISAVQAVGAKG